MSDLVDTFLSQAQADFLGDPRTTARYATDILKIASDPVASAYFTGCFPQQIQNKERRRLIVSYMHHVADDMGDIADEREINVQTIEKIVLPVMLSIAGLGIAATIASGGALIPITVGCGGVLGLVAAGIGGSRLKHAILKGRVAARKINRLTAGLGVTE